MASFVIHHIAGVKFLETTFIDLTREEKNQFLLGNLIVDSVKTEVNTPENINNEESKKIKDNHFKIIQLEKMEAHFRDINDKKLIIQPPKIDKFLSKYFDLVLTDITALGYLFHLYTDKIFFENLFNETFEFFSKDKNPTIYISDASIVKVKKNNQEHNINDFFDYKYQFGIYNDYTIINKILLQHYSIKFNLEELIDAADKFINPGIEEVDYKKIIKIIEQTDLFIKESYEYPKNELNVFDENIIKKFIEVVLDGFVNDYGYLLDNIKNKFSEKIKKMK